MIVNRFTEMIPVRGSDEESILVHAGSERHHSVEIGELHAREVRAHLRGHQMPVSGIDVSAEGMALPRRSAGCQDHRTGIDTPRPFHLALVTRCTGHRPTGIYEKFQCRTVIEYEYTGLLHLPPKESKVVRSCTGERSLTGAGAKSVPEPRGFVLGL